MKRPRVSLTLVPVSVLLVLACLKRASAASLIVVAITLGAAVPAVWAAEAEKPPVPANVPEYDAKFVKMEELATWLLAASWGLRARETISWANMKKQGSAAPLLFHLPVWLSSRKNTHFSALPWVQ